jgi:hypothetical protein
LNEKGRPMKQIHITRDSSGKVTFETVSIDETETVFFTNQDTTQAHWPTLATNQLGPSPSPNSSQCTVPAPAAGKTQVTYGCKISGHQNEQGIINVFEALAAATTTLANATRNQAINPQQVVIGGMPRYAISGAIFQVKDNNNNVIQSGSGIGPGLQMIQKADTNGVWGLWVSGTPTVSGTYNFTFTVNDAMGRNLQQVQYSMKVV